MARIDDTGNLDYGYDPLQDPTQQQLDSLFNGPAPAPAQPNLTTEPVAMMDPSGATSTGAGPSVTPDTGGLSGDVLVNGAPSTGGTSTGAGYANVPGFEESKLSNPSYSDPKYSDDARLFSQALAATGAQPGTAGLQSVVDWMNKNGGAGKYAVTGQDKINGIDAIKASNTGSPSWWFNNQPGAGGPGAGTTPPPNGTTTAGGGDLSGSLSSYLQSIFGNMGSNLGSPAGSPTDLNAGIRGTLTSGLNSLIGKYSADVSPDDPIIKANTDAYHGVNARNLSDYGEAMAERAHAEGMPTGAFDAAITNAYGSAGRGEAAYTGGLMTSEQGQRRAALSDILTKTGSYLSDQDRMALQDKISSIDAALSNKGLDNSFSLGQGSLVNQGKSIDNSFALGQGSLANQKTGLNNQNQQFYDNLGFEMNNSANSLDSQIYKLLYGAGAGA